ncbi:hypothetical protein [Thalassotalea litorea]|uniref:hypothetical protein n=1 Tax=Thalassotalea litorea TaxID=2020715 RepID=UPI001FE2B264|nr:hypothetical protein [Thalassotalea litorea]
MFFKSGNHSVNTRRFIAYLVIALCATSNLVFAAGSQQAPRPYFNPDKDILISQFDVKPDADDVHSVAALGSLLADPDFNNISHLAVNGTIGSQQGKYIDASGLFSLAFGPAGKAWTDANTHWQGSVELVQKTAKDILDSGGRVWVQEAGQSDFTAQWLAGLIAQGVNKSSLKSDVIVVQHSAWNEQQTSEEALAFVKQYTHYIAIGDGNKPKRLYIRKNRRGPATPIYVENGDKWLKAAIDKRNTNQHARTLWQVADAIIADSNFTADYSVIPNGGVDFSDTVAVWWILNLGQDAVSVNAFWQRYVTDVPLDHVNPPEGRLAIVIDGNSPDPDDIGATPVIFGLLHHSGLEQRLVHVSHSCDLDPFTNKARYQIDKDNEQRRQRILNELTDKSIALFGPFEHLHDHYNCREKQAAASQDLVNAINDSTAESPLWIIEAGEPDLIGFALAAANPQALQFVHIVSHHPANDNSGDFFTWQQILDFGITEHQIGDQNVGLQTSIHQWDWAKHHDNPGYKFIWEMLAYAEQDGIVPFQTNKFDCSDAGMVYWWITGADQGGNNFATANDIQKMLHLKENN